MSAGSSSRRSPCCCCRCAAKGFSSARSAARSFAAFGAIPKQRRWPLISARRVLNFGWRQFDKKQRGKLPRCFLFRNRDRVLNVLRYGSNGRSVSERRGRRPSSGCGRFTGGSQTRATVSHESGFSPWLRASRRASLTWPMPPLYAARMMLIRSSSGVPGAKRSPASIFESTCAASRTLVSGSRSRSPVTLNWRATAGMICISPAAPRFETMSGEKRDSW